MRTPRLTVGDVIHVPEPDYCYGLGELCLRITQAPAEALTTGWGWAELAGVDILHDGSEGRERFVMVRLAAVRVGPAE